MAAGLFLDVFVESLDGLLKGFLLLVGSDAAASFALRLAMQCALVGVHMHREILVIASVFILELLLCLSRLARQCSRSDEVCVR